WRPPAPSTRAAPRSRPWWRASRWSAEMAQDLRGHLRESMVWYGGLGLLAARVVRNLTLPPSYFWLVAREVDIIGVRSLTVALTAALFTGMVLALQTAVNMARFGAENELGPVLTAILVGGKVASGITAELGSMKVTEQIDALRALGVNYIKKLVVPR